MNGITRSVRLITTATVLMGSLTLAQYPAAKSMLGSRPREGAVETAHYPPTSRVAGDIGVVNSGLVIAKLLGPKGVPRSAAPDVVGAFRFLCGPGQIISDDPIMYPGKPGAAHLHQFFGNLSADAHSTYESLRRSGSSTCMNELNRSAYWMPAMLDGRGNVVRPDNVSIYYKRRPQTDPFCQAAGKCVGLPRGLRYIFGWDQTRPTQPQPENSAKFNFKCISNGHPTTPAFPTMAEPLRTCRPGQQLNAVIHTPPCWNGRELDTNDHRSHMADMQRNAATKYKSKCPSSHPYIVPQFTMGVVYSIEIGDDPALWRLSSDHMAPGDVAGSTFHSDWFGAWEDEVLERWQAGCVDKMLNCSDGDLGDGAIMTRGAHYPQGKAKPRLVPLAG